VRRLSIEEQELWGRVTATIRPLSRELTKAAAPVEAKAVGPLPSVARTAAPVSAKPKGPPPAKRPPPKPVVRPGTTLDGSWDRRLSGGRFEPDRVLDLHGHDLHGAWGAIDRTLEAAIADGDRVILLVTGHYRRGEPPIERGRIRAAVGDWLAVSRHASKIAAVRNAHPRHGGGGSLYLVLRRPAAPDRQGRSTFP
jgi:DNA-nicking Smr family endonuclease